MLAQARRRVRRKGWTNVILVQADAAALSPSDVAAGIAARGGRAASDGALSTYALSLMPDWRRAWANMLLLTARGASMGVVDMQVPAGKHSFTAPLARAACRLGGADITAHPWSGVERDCTDVTADSARGGHLQIRTGRRT
jgi:demethylmenaquinone methyltransferase/2-methoxy-6-polyprenyl-1,4-benzoquinol methylase